MSLNINKRIVIKSDDQQIVMGVVYAPNMIDTQGEAMTAAEIRKMAYKFILNNRLDQIDFLHDSEPTGSKIVEFFFARECDPLFPVDSWVIAVWVPNPAIWALIKAGVINGFSFGATDGVEREMWVHLDHPVKAVGTTELSDETGPLPAHTHDATVYFDENGDVIPTMTGETLEHRHAILGMTATEVEENHGHRLLLEPEREPLADAA